MNRKEYMNQLAYRLRKLPKEDYDRAMEYFYEYFEEAGPEYEEQAIKDLGSPETAADHIIQDIAYETLNQPVTERPVRRGASVIWLVVLALFASPIALPLAFGLLMIIIALLFSAFVCVASVAFTAFTIVGTSIIGIIGGIISLFTSLTSGITTIGLSTCLLGIGILATVGTVKLIRFFGRWIPRVLQRFLKKRGDDRHDKN